MPVTTTCTRVSAMVVDDLELGICKAEIVLLNLRTGMGDQDYEHKMRLFSNTVINV